MAIGRAEPVRGDNVAIPGLAGLTEIGRGGFGVVYRATENELGREVAVKVLSGPLDERSRTRFERERRAMGVLSSHPAIVTVFRSGTAPSGEPYLVMEYLPGGSFADRLVASGPIDWQSVVTIGVELCGALESAHRAGVLHRDVKPGNIMVDGLGRAQLGDFGIARLDGSPETKSSVITASIAHAPPEVIAGDKPDERSDVYSLASTLFELISGTPAFVRSGDESMIPLFNRIVNDPMPDLRVGGVPDRLAVVLEKAMAKDRTERFASAAALGEALVEVQRASGLPETRLWVADEPELAATDDESTQVVAPPAQSTGQTGPGGPGGAAQTPPPPPAQQAPSGPAPGTYPGQPTPQPQQPGPQPAWPAPAAAQQPQPFQAPPQHPHGQQAPPPPSQSAPYPGQASGGYAVPGQAPGADPRTGYLPPPANTGPGPNQGYPASPVTPPPSSGGSRTKYILTALATVLVVVVGLGIIGALAGDGDDSAQGEGTDDVPEVDTFSGDRDPDEADDTTTSLEPTTTESTITTEPAPTVPPRSALLADLPSLPAIEQPYDRYRTVSDPDGSFILEVPNDWSDELPTDGQIIVSPDNNAALASATISGGVVSGSQSIGLWDADFFLDALIEQAADPDNPCSEVAREIYDDGVFDGLLYAEYCNGGDLLIVSVLASDPNRDTVFLVSSQMTDERDMAAFQRMLDSFVLLNASTLPEVE